MKSVSLSECQNKFWLALHKMDSDINSIISEIGELTIDTRLSVYRTTGKSLHVSVLLSIYPVCGKILGAKYFKFIANKYYHEHPSTGHDLNDYGESFPSFIKTVIQSREEMHDFPYLVDLLVLEWCIHKSYYSADAQLLNMNELEMLFKKHAGEIKFHLREDVMLLKSEYPIRTIWENHQHDNSVSEVAAINQHEFFCVNRSQFEVSCDDINEDVYKVLNGVKQGMSLNEITEMFANSDELNLALETCMSNQWLSV